MNYAENIIKEAIRMYPCCEAWAIPFSLLGAQEKNFFNEFASTFKTAVVIGHHITTKAEWTWYMDENSNEHCGADNHTGEVCGHLREAFGEYGFQAGIVPYPGESGLRFRFVAWAAGAGDIGMNAFLLHPEWGPWIHLRILATDAPSRINQLSRRKVCKACGACISSCPSNAVRADSFNGLLCRGYRKAKGEYIPFGPERELRYCTICADVCPVGRRPRS
jgi:epoxyqueuosine reductase